MGILTLSNICIINSFVGLRLADSISSLSGPDGQGQENYKGRKIPWYQYQERQMILLQFTLIILIIATGICTWIIVSTFKTSQEERREFKQNEEKLQTCTDALNEVVQAFKKLGIK